MSNYGSYRANFREVKREIFSDIPNRCGKGSGPRSSTHLCGFRTILAETWATRRYQLGDAQGRVHERSGRGVQTVEIIEFEITEATEEDLDAIYDVDKKLLATR